MAGGAEVVSQLQCQVQQQAELRTLKVSSTANSGLIPGLQDSLVVGRAITMLTT